MKIYDGIVVGAGHAGVEAALAMARMKLNTLLISGDFNKVATLPCNPSIGGPAKGVVVREIDALGGEMAKAADLGLIQMKMLNASKGPAVRALRAQIDKLEYPKIMRKALEQQDNLELLEEFVDRLIVEDNQVKGIILENNTKIYGKTVIITTGTYLASTILIGHEKINKGPGGDKTTYGISGQLKDLGFEVIRLKTGTPPRIAKDSIDYSKMTIQPGDDKYQTFSYNSPRKEIVNQVDCYLLHTSNTTRELVLNNLDNSAMYGGVVEGVGPRYCPSIEDKYMRFLDKPKHQIFVEPESLLIDEMYLQGLSTSMPRDVQEKMVKSLPGFENAKIVKYAYAIEYDAINPSQLYKTLETKIIKNLYTAGQINGTSGYEEAAAQGIMAGINAGLKVLNKKPFILNRDEAYIGVLIDDLITKGTHEPYRLLTSRAEFRLLLRNDNADIRLMDYGYELGLINDEIYDKFNKKKDDINKLLELTNEIRINPTQENLDYLDSKNTSPIYEGVKLYDLIKRPELGRETIKHFVNSNFNDEIYEQVEIHIKYNGYIEKARREADKMLGFEKLDIPVNINYEKVSHLANEAREKLSKIRPETIGQASRIIGVNPSDVSLLVTYLKNYKYD